MAIRGDALPKLTGRAPFVGDVVLPGMVYAAVTRSYAPHARITAIHTDEARALPGVLAVVTAADITDNLYGRRVKDVPILAKDKVRFVGERVAAVAAETREIAEQAAALIDVEYEDLPAVFDADEAMQVGAPLVHDAPESYANAPEIPHRPPNVQSLIAEGSMDAVDAALAGSAHSVDFEYRTPAGHQGYIEPQGCVVSFDDAGTLHVWASNKSPYRLREQVGECLGLSASDIVIEPVFIGGDFGGKGSPMDVPLCAELARITGRPVKYILRYVDDLIAGNPRHPARMRVRVGCDAEGRITGLAFDAVINGGAYAGFKPRNDVSLHGMMDCAMPYDIDNFAARAAIAYTHTVPKGHMRAPGSPQSNFAVESALDELAEVAGIDPVELRLRNVVTRDEEDGGQAARVLRAAVDRAKELARPGEQDVHLGVALYARSASPGTGSLRVTRRGEKLEAEVGVPETGTGSHDIVARYLSRDLGVPPEDLVVRQVSTAGLPYDSGAGGSRVTLTLLKLLEEMNSEEARARLDAEGTASVELKAGSGGTARSFCAQVARVSVDQDTGQFDVHDLVTAMDAGLIVSDVAHQMQIEGGAVMGLGFALFEDLGEEDGQVWSANLGEFRLPTAGDLPEMHTVIVPDEAFVNANMAKSVGELTNNAVAAAVANALGAAGVRLRKLPLTAEAVFWALHGEEENA